MKTGYKVIDVMKKKPITVDPENDVLSCAKLMAEHKIGSLIIKQADKVAGMITNEDVMRKVLASGKEASKTKVKDIMSKAVVFAEPENDLYDVLVKMRDKDIRHVPVVDEGKLIGIITLKDILKVEPQMFDYIAEKCQKKESRREPAKLRVRDSECESCGQFADVLQMVDGRLLCETCMNSDEEED